MKLVVIGCGRVGSAVARDLAEDGWDVTAVDEQEEALARLGARWAGGFILGHGMDAEILRRAGVPDADAVVVATSGDNTNLDRGETNCDEAGQEASNPQDASCEETGTPGDGGDGTEGDG